MAAAATAGSLLRHRQFLLRSTKSARSKHSVPDPVEAPIKWRTNSTNQNSVPLFPISAAKRKQPSSSPNLGLVSWYLSMIKTRPVATKSITAAFIYAAADLSSQKITGKSGEGYDLVRTLRVAGYGGLIVGPSLHYWFNFMSRVFPKRDILSTFAKMALGQTVYGPIVTVLFFSGNAALQGENGSEIVARLKRDLVPTLAKGVMYWPMCDLITFRFIPVHLQPLVSNSFSYLWTVYLTYMAGLEKVD